MLRRLHKQSRLNTCGVASLRTVLDLQLGIRVSEQALEAHGDDAHEPITVHGTGTAQFRRMLVGVNRTHNTSRKRLTLKVRTHATVQDLYLEVREGRVPMTRMYEPNQDITYHLVVVVDVDLDADAVLVFDPSPNSPARPRWMLSAEFTAWWFGDGQDTWYAVVSGDFTPRTRRRQRLTNHTAGALPPKEPHDLEEVPLPPDV